MTHSDLSRDQPDVESFDTVPLIELPPDLFMELPHFRVQSGPDTTSVIAENAPGDAPPGRRLGILRGDGATSLSLWFAQPRQHLTFTLFTPPGRLEQVTTATFYGAGRTPLQVLEVHHERDAQRMRLGLSLPSGGSFDGLTFHMPVGTYIDDIQMLSPVNGEVAEVTFDELALGPVSSLIVQPTYFIIAAQGAIRIARANADETYGHVLTSDSLAGNDVSVIFGTRRSTLDLTVVPDPDAGDAVIEFLSGGNFDILHSVSIEPTGGARQLSHTESAPGKTIQGVRWTGGKLSLDHLVLHARQ